MIYAVDGFWYSSSLNAVVAFNISPNSRTITRYNDLWNIVVNGNQQTKVEYFIYYR